jgi:RNA polymerase sigma factor (sigma-70 family)
MQTIFNAAGSPGFPSTHWSMILTAGNNLDPGGRLALEDLCRAYWFPIYSFVRRRGYDAHSAQDITQDFFAHLLTGNRVGVADPARGRFRSFLLGSLRNFLSHEHRHRSALKRGGSTAIVSLDAAAADEKFRLEPQSSDLSPEEAYDRAWALQLIERSMAALESDYRDSGRSALFDRLRQVVWGDCRDSIETLAGDLGMSPGSIKVAIHRLRRRLREQLKQEVGCTLGSAVETDDELRLLLAALRPGRPQAV